MSGTLNGFVAALSGFDPDLPVVFATGEAEIAGGYHVTELKHLTVASIDCGGNRRAWEETVMELLDGEGGAHMRLGKLLGILEQSLAAIPTLGGLPFAVEFAPGNRGLRRLGLGELRQEGGRLSVALLDGAAQCKPAVERAALGQAACCAVPA